MIERRLKRPRDPIQLAKLIGDIVTGQVERLDAAAIWSESNRQRGQCRRADILGKPKFLLGTGALSNSGPIIAWAVLHDLVHAIQGL